MPPSHSNLIRRRQAWFSLIFLVCILASMAGLDLLARNQSLSAWLYRHEMEFAAKTSNQIHDRGYFIDQEDRVLTEELPKANYTNGGTFIFGTCNARVDLPPDSPIHDYATANTSHTDSDEFLKYLIQKRKLFSDSTKKSYVIYAVSYQDAREDPGQYFFKLWERHGLYAYTPTEGINDVSANPVQIFVSLERTRMSGFISTLGEFGVEQMHLLVNRGGEPPKRHYPEQYKKANLTYMGPDWQRNMAGQVEVFTRRIQDLKKRGVNIVVVLLPMGSWEDEMPYKKAYSDQIKELCRTENLPMFDWTTMLPDAEFDDSMHPDAVGMAKLSKAFQQLASSLPGSSNTIAP